jgi:ribonuclease P protein component
MRLSASKRVEGPHCKHCIWHSLKSADFAAVLAVPARGKSEHFALHHLAQAPQSAAAHAGCATVEQLSTDGAPIEAADVDKSPALARSWLGLVVPKRHARRSVTRNLIKRQMRTHAAAHRDALGAGQWVVRLRAPFDVRRFDSGQSDLLRSATHSELERVFASALRR